MSTDKYKKTAPPVKVYSKRELQARQAKKSAHVENLANNMQSLRYNITRDLNSDDEKVFLTATTLLVMEKTGERVGNSISMRNGHRGVTGLLKSQVKVDGNTVTFKYTGKSGVKHEKVVTDSRLAENIRIALELSDSKYLFCTSDGFLIKADRINRYLKDFDVTAKALRGYSANVWLIEKLKQKDIPDTEKDRKKEFLNSAQVVSKKIGHSRNMLRSQYLLPELENQYILHGKIIDVKDGKTYKLGGSTSKYK